MAGGVTLYMDQSKVEVKYAGHETAMFGDKLTWVRFVGSLSYLDTYVRPGSKFIVKQADGYYYYVGDVILAKEVGKVLVNNKEHTVFELVVENLGVREEKFRVKNDICARFGWAPLNKYAATRGVICHVSA